MSCSCEPLSAEMIETASQQQPRRMILVGNANVGKSLLFTRLTRRYVTVSNYPGTTVELARAKADFCGELREVIDTPGTSGLNARSDDERVTRDVLLGNRDADVILVGDITNMRRTLLLALQLIEHGIRFVICLNMADELPQSVPDLSLLSSRLGIPVIAASALREWNLERLKRAAMQPAAGKVRVLYGSEVEAAVADMNGVTRGEALARLEEAHALPIAAARHAAVEQLLDGRGDEHAVSGFRDALGRITMHRIWGVPALLFVLFIGWLFVGKLGAGVLVDFLQTKVFEAHLNVWARRLVDALVPVHFLRELLVGPYGLITMALTYAIAIVLPVVITFFLFFGILEDSGYLPRLAVMLHRTFRRIGLNGKAVLPMVLGLGCDTMATLTTRILETKKERVIVTILLALGVPCSAQLGVIIAMLAPLGARATAIWLFVTIGTMLLVGALASKVLPGESGDFILEIPPMRMPKLSNIAIKVAARTEWYLKEAVPLFLAGTLLLYLLDAANLLVRLQRALAPLVVGLLGLPAQSSNAFVVGFLRRDYGAAGLFAMQRAGQLSPTQTIVALTVITLFVPCVANFFVMVKERGARTATAAALFITVYSFGTGVLLHAILGS